jgi:hypothetical protein
VLLARVFLYPALSERPGEKVDLQRLLPDLRAQFLLSSAASAPAAVCPPLAGCGWTRFGGPNDRMSSL